MAPMLMALMLLLLLALLAAPVSPDRGPECAAPAPPAEVVAARFSGASTDARTLELHEGGRWTGSTFMNVAHTHGSNTHFPTSPLDC